MPPPMPKRQGSTPLSDEPTTIDRHREDLPVPVVILLRARPGVPGGPPGRFQVILRPWITRINTMMIAITSRM